MSSHLQSGNPSSGPIPLPLDPLPIYELNQARRRRVSAELEALSECKSRSSQAFLEWPTVEGLEAFVEKKVEFADMMEDMIEFARSVVREQLVYVEAKQRAAKRAEELRLQEFHRALEHMDPAEAEAAQQAERERALRLQKEREARAAELEAEIALIRARVRQEYS
ncbi:hypothetical protein F5148DRAFT_1181781 [Russula earlei]|uniref:Uncharacterized protein n=1 Tax=Russula earlei TaxID=71964 RepID=A0ACC0UES7_9AGAM|nr:hypothetical protein F5148DRAFT_1181781 [Russula earlei]